MSRAWNTGKRKRSSRWRDGVGVYIRIDPPPPSLADGGRSPVVPIGDSQFCAARLHLQEKDGGRRVGAEVRSAHCTGFLAGSCALAARRPGWQRHVSGQHAQHSQCDPPPPQPGDPQEQPTHCTHAEILSAHTGKRARDRSGRPPLHCAQPARRPGCAVVRCNVALASVAHSPHTHHTLTTSLSRALPSHWLEPAHLSPPTDVRNATDWPRRGEHCQAAACRGLARPDFVPAVPAPLCSGIAPHTAVT